MDNIIEIENISYSYDDNTALDAVLNDFSLKIERGSFTVILGKNGSGKSTLAKLLNGLFKPLTGSVKVNGLSTSNSDDIKEIRRSVGLVFQNPDNQLIASVVEEDVAFGPENLGLEPEIIRQRVDEALKITDMYDYRLSTPHKLSGGQKQRVAIAGILAMQPDCIVLDEPTAMLDPKGRAEVLKTLHKLNKQNNITVVLITHYMEEAENANRVLVMADGNIIADGIPADIFSNKSVLENAGLQVPQTTQLLNRLNASGIKVKQNCIGVEETANAILEALK